MMERKSGTAIDSDDDWDVEPEPVYAARSAPAPAPAPPARERPRVAEAPHVAFPYCGKPGHIPGLFCRSALFGAHRSAASGCPAEILSIPAQGQYAIEFEGIPLSMRDKSIFESLVRLAKRASHDLSADFHTSLSAIAVEAGAARGGRALDGITASLHRLQTACIGYRLWDGTQGRGRLLGHFDVSASGLCARFDSGLILDLFGKDKQFSIDSARRDSLDSPLAQWLHDFLSTHNAGEKLTYDYLLSRSGFTARRKNFPAQLVRALDAIHAIAPGLVASYAVAKPTQDSAKWTLCVASGGEKPSFEDPSKKGHGGARQALPRRGGVAL